MRVQQIMNQPVHTCGPDDSLEVPARMMWEHDIGCVPVVDAEQRPVGVITDRDICVAAYTQGRTLRDIAVHTSMAHKVISCTPEDTVERAERLMRHAQVRRLPVCDRDGRVVGMLSLGDLAVESSHERGHFHRSVAASELVETMGAICEPRSGALSARPM